MTRHARPNCCAYALLAGVMLASVACRSKPEAGRAARATQACERLCRLAVRGAEGTAADPCRRGCLAQFSAAGDGCAASALIWLECRADRASEASVATGRLGTLDPCGSAHAELERCTAVCRRDGILQSGEQRLTDQSPPKAVAFEVRYYGCSHCSIEPGAAAGARCSSPKVCAADCFSCRSHLRSVSMRACVDGHCAATTELAGLMQRLDMMAPCSQE